MNGYIRVASLMAAHNELAIVRAYKSAYALDVLYHQAELLHLLQDWAEEVKEDQNADEEDKRSFDSYFHGLAMPEAGGEPNFQWVKWLDVRKKLKEYRQAITAFREMSDESPAHMTDVETLRIWLRSPGAGDGFLQGSEVKTWAEGADDDLVYVVKRDEKDAFMKWVRGPAMSWIHDNITDRFTKEVELRNHFLAEGDLPTPLKKYSSAVIEATVSAVSTILASLFPAMSILALYFVQNQLMRLVIIVAFSTLFSTVLVLVAKAKRVDCFAATAAFAAVQVVFVGQQGAVCNCS